jgi:zinc protease
MSAATISTPHVVVPALTQSRRARKPTSAQRRFGSGLEATAVRRSGVPLVEVRLRVPFLADRASHPARAALLSDTVLTGTAQRDRTELAAAVQALGADLSVSVDADRLMIGGAVLASEIRGLLALISEVLTEASYPDTAVATERDRLIEKVTIARSRAGVVASEALARRMYGDHPYGRDLPQADDLAATTARQLRKLHADFVRPEAASLIVVGDLSPERVLDLADELLGAWTGERSRSRIRRLTEPMLGPLQLTDRPGSVQSALRMGAAALRRDDERYPALQLANTIFGGYFSSRWTENLRENKGYSYGPHSRIEHHVLGSALLLDADVATEVTGPALLETWYELGRIASLPVTPAEVEAVRQYVIGTMALSTATQAGLASTLAGLAGTGLGLPWLADHPRRLARLSVDEVSAAAAEFLAPSRFVSVVVGDADAVAGPLSALTTVGVDDAD